MLSATRIEANGNEKDFCRCIKNVGGLSKFMYNLQEWLTAFRRLGSSFDWLWRPDEVIGHWKASHP